MVNSLWNKVRDFLEDSHCRLKKTAIFPQKINHFTSCKETTKSAYRKMSIKNYRNNENESKMSPTQKNEAKNHSLFFLSDALFHFSLENYF